MQQLQADGMLNYGAPSDYTELPIMQSPLTQQQSIQDWVQAGPEGPSKLHSLTDQTPKLPPTIIPFPFPKLTWGKIPRLIYGFCQWVKPKFDSDFPILEGDLKDSGEGRICIILWQQPMMWIHLEGKTKRLETRRSEAKACGWTHGHECKVWRLFNHIVNTQQKTCTLKEALNNQVGNFFQVIGIGHLSSSAPSEPHIDIWREQPG